MAHINISEEEKQKLLEKGAKDSEHIKECHPGMAPVIMERYEKKFKEVKQMEKNKFLFEVKQPALQAMIRTQEEVQSKRKLWFFVYHKGKPKEVFPAAKIGVLYRRYKDVDGNLYIYYTDINMFPNQERTMIILQLIVVVLILIYGYNWALHNEYI